MRPRSWSPARQLLVLQALLLLGVVALGAATAYGDARRDSADRARSVVLGAAQTLATSPEARRAMATGDPSATPGGSGLGLAQVGQVVHRLGGRVDAGPAAAGPGAVFTVHLPLHPAPAAEGGAVTGVAPLP